MRHAVALLCVCMLGGCASGGCRVGEPGIVAQLYFGRAMQGGQPIDDAAWRDFLARNVTPRFPDGLTVLDGYGQWRSRSTGAIGREDSTVVVIATDAGPETAAKLEAIRAEYRTRFAQESVGLVTSAACSSF